MKRSIKKAEMSLDKNGKDQSTGKWLTITSVMTYFDIISILTLKN